MAETGLSFGIISAIFAFIGIVLPIIMYFLLGKSPNRGIVLISLMLTAACCYIFWITTFISQLNPLIGPQLDVGVIQIIQEEWK